MASLSTECIRITNCACDGRQCVRNNGGVDMRVLNPDGSLFKIEEMGDRWMDFCVIPRTWKEQLLDIDGVRREAPRVLSEDF